MSGETSRVDIIENSGLVLLYESIIDSGDESGFLDRISISPKKINPDFPDNLQIGAFGIGRDVFVEDEHYVVDRLDDWSENSQVYLVKGVAHTLLDDLYTIKKKDIPFSLVIPKSGKVLRKDGSETSSVGVILNGRI